MSAAVRNLEVPPSLADLMIFLWRLPTVVGNGWTSARLAKRASHCAAQAINSALEARASVNIPFDTLDKSRVSMKTFQTRTVKTHVLIKRFLSSSGIVSSAPADANGDTMVEGKGFGAHL
jgi:hypothetical protein